jgi:hypothetical protein
MIRTTALTLICLAGLGAIAGAAIKSTPPLPEIVRPVVAGNKADRLPLVVNEDPLKAAEKIDTAYVQPVGEVQSSPPAETPPVATPAASDPKPSKVDAPRRAKATTASRQNVSRSKRVAAADRSPQGSEHASCDAGQRITFEPDKRVERMLFVGARSASAKAEPGSAVQLTRLPTASSELYGNSRNAR